MGSEAVDVKSDNSSSIEEFNDVNNTVFVAVGKNVKESKSLILWTMQNFPDMKICILHVKQHDQLITLCKLITL